MTALKETELSSSDDAYAKALQDFSDWIVAQGLSGGDLGPLVVGFCTRLREIGVPLMRMHVSIATLHPAVVGFGGNWWLESGFHAENYDRAGEVLDNWQLSPLKMLRDGLIPSMRVCLDGNEPLDFPVLQKFRELGGTDWIGRTVRFGDGEDDTGLPGMLVSWLTDRPGGFTDRDLALLERMLPRLALACYRVSLKRVAHDLLEAYVGFDAGRRVLSGQIERGAASRLFAVVLIADLRGFTQFADTTPGEEVLATLNAAFGDLTDALEAHRGQVLKFLGDGLLAIFSLEDKDTSATCADALAAAETALAANTRWNRTRQEAGESPLVLDIALHLGEVMYGNVGSERRLDFTVIGPAVNEASRIEALCKSLGHQLLISESFATAYNRPLTSIGEHQLRGVARPQELFTAPGSGRAGQ